MPVYFENQSLTLGSMLASTTQRSKHVELPDTSNEPPQSTGNLLTMCSRFSARRNTLLAWDDEVLHFPHYQTTNETHILESQDEE